MRRTPIRLVKRCSFKGLRGSIRIERSSYPYPTFNLKKSFGSSMISLLRWTFPSYLISRSESHFRRSPLLLGTKLVHSFKIFFFFLFSIRKQEMRSTPTQTKETNRNGLGPFLRWWVNIRNPGHFPISLEISMMWFGGRFLSQKCPFFSIIRWFEYLVNNKSSRFSRNLGRFITRV